MACPSLYSNLLKLFYLFQLKIHQVNQKNQGHFQNYQKLQRKCECPKASELRAKAEAEQHAFRCLRMCLRYICNSLRTTQKVTAQYFEEVEQMVQIENMGVEMY